MTGHPKTRAERRAVRRRWVSRCVNYIKHTWLAFPLFKGRDPVEDARWAHWNEEHARKMADNRATCSCPLHDEAAVEYKRRKLELEDE